MSRRAPAPPKKRSRGRPRGPTVSRHDVVRAALRIVELQGLAGFSVHEVARALGIQAASLYNHVRGIDELHGLVAAEGYRALLESLRIAGAQATSPEECILTFAQAYRRFAVARPKLYVTMTAVPLPEGPDKAELRSTLFALLGGALSALGVEGAQLVDAIRTLRSTLFGFVALELGGELEMRESAEQSFDYAVTTLVLGWRSRAT